MKLRQLDCFIHVCDVGSITGAARDLNIAQPALGLQIRGLEHEFGATLLVRSFRGVTLTPAGEEVLRWARSIREQTEEVRQRLSEMAGADPTTFTIALTPSLTNLISGDLVERVRARFPDMRLRIAEGMSYSIAQWVDDRSVDIAIASGPFETEQVEYTPVVSERLFYICKNEGVEGPIKLSDVLQRPLALPAQFHSVRSKLEEAAATIGIPVQASLETASVYAALDLASRGIAGSVGPYASIAERWSGNLTVRPIVEPIVERTLYIMRPTSRRIGAAEQRLLQILRNMLHSITAEESAGAGYRLLTNKEEPGREPASLAAARKSSGGFSSYAVRRSPQRQMARSRAAP